MTPHLLIRSGARAGARIRVDSDRLRIGRRPDLEVALDPERDLEVSALHAELSRVEGTWFLKDLGSRNGTFLNGRPLGPQPVRVEMGDEIRLGPRGPLLEIRSPRFRTSPPPAVPPGSARTETSAGHSDERPPGPETQARIQIHDMSRRYRWGALGLVLVLSFVVGSILLITSRERAEWAQERAELESRADSLLRVEEEVTRTLQAELQELDQALERSRAELREIRQEVAAGSAPAGAPAESVEEEAPGAPSAERAELEQRLREATAALERQQLAASLDFDGIRDANRQAVAMIFVEQPGGEVATGSGFAVGTSGVLLTSRHLLLEEGGEDPPSRIAVQFTDSSQVFPARLLGASSEWDVAALQVENLEGEVPVVAGLNLRPDTLSSGTPVASLGFPLGGEVGTVGGERAPVRPLLSAGVLMGQTSGGMEIQGYGQPGASGSPIFDGSGQVVGILYGGRQDGDVRVLLAVPIPAALPLLEAIRGGDG